MRKRKRLSDAQILKNYERAIERRLSDAQVLKNHKRVMEQLSNARILRIHKWAMEMEKPGIISYDLLLRFFGVHTFGMLFKREVFKILVAREERRLIRNMT